MFLFFGDSGLKLLGLRWRGGRAAAALSLGLAGQVARGSLGHEVGARAWVGACVSARACDVALRATAKA